MSKNNHKKKYKGKKRSKNQAKNHSVNISKPKIVKKESLIGKITGKNDAIFLRDKYQQELDIAWLAIVKMVHYLEKRNDYLVNALNIAKNIRQNIQAHEEERNVLYNSLNNILNKETDFEKEMWEATQKDKIKTVVIKQDFKDSKIDNIPFDSMLNYLKKYPEYVSKSSFKKILGDIEQKENELKREKKEYNHAVGKYNSQLFSFEKDIQKAEDKFNAYSKILEKGKKALKKTRYRKTFYHLISQKEKQKVEIDTLKHRFEQFRNTLNILKEQHIKNKTKPFEELDY